MILEGEVKIRSVTSEQFASHFSKDSLDAKEVFTCT